MAILNNSNAISSGGYDINNSLRFRSSASAYLSRTFSANPSTRTKCHWHWIVKRGQLGSDQRMFSGYSGTSGDSTFLNFKSDDTFQFNVGGSNGTLVTTAVFRDPSAWYILDLAFDSTQAVAANRAKFWVNGVQQTWAGGTVTLNSVTEFALANANNRVGSNWDSSLTFDGYMTDINFIDGTALTPSSFGETDTTTGSWKPKAYTGTYGTNGFYLKFSDIATTSGSNAGLGKDFSGNTNYFTTNNISVTAGTTYDAMTDSPTLTSATVGNYCTLNPLLRSNSSITNANTTMTTTGGAGSNQWTLASGTQFPTSGKWYFEVYINTKTGDAGGSSVGIGVQSNQANTTYPLGNYLGQQTTGEYNYQGHGYTYFNNVQSGSAVWASYTTGDTIGVAFDVDALTCSWYKNNTLQGSTSLLSGYGYAPAFSIYQASQATLNCGQRPFAYTPPTGFVRLNTYNL